MTNKLKANHFESYKSAPSVVSYSIPLILLCSLSALIFTFISAFYILGVKYYPIVNFADIWGLTYYSLMYILDLSQQEFGWIDWFTQLDDTQQNKFIVVVELTGHFNKGL